MIPALHKNNKSSLNYEPEEYQLSIFTVNNTYFRRRLIMDCAFSDSIEFQKRLLLSLPILLVILVVNSTALFMPSVVYGEEINTNAVDEKNQSKEAVEKNPDPLESINRISFWITDKSDYYVLRPMAIAYDFVLPDFASQAITNIFMNLTDVQIMLNNLFQLKLKASSIDAGRIGVNSTIGILGIFDVATKLGLEKHYEDFGQTLGFWGIPSGPYLFIPFLGPSSFRDAVGLVGEYYLTPRNYINRTRTRNQLFLTETVDRRSRALKVENVVFGDKYIFLRDFYINRRHYLVNDGLENQSLEEDIFDDEFDNDLDDSDFIDMDGFEEE